MAYPFLLGIPLPGRNRSQTGTPVAEGQEQTVSTSDWRSPDVPVKTENDIKQEQLDDVSFTSASDSTSPSAPTAEEGEHTPDSPGRIDQTTRNTLALRNGRSSVSTSPTDRQSPHSERHRSVLGSRKVVIDLTADDDSDSTPLAYTDSSEANPVIVKDDPDSKPVPNTPVLSPSRSETPQSVKQDPEESENDTVIPAANGCATRGTKRPSDRTPGGEDTDVDQPPPKKRGRPKKPPPPPIYKATAQRAKGTSDIPGALDIDDSVFAKIKKCFERAEHKNASEGETRAALALAGKMMQRYNVIKAEVMQYKTAEEQAQSAGESRVVITRSDDKEQVIPIRQWISDLASAMTIFFDVKSYSSTPPSRYRIEWVFYGFAQNTASAALAFEKIYNLIMDWSQRKKGIAARNSYCLGITWHLYLDAEKEKDEEMIKAKKAEAEELARREKEEQLQRQQELARLQPTVEDEPESEPEPEPNANSAKEPILEEIANPDPAVISESGRDHADIVDLGDVSSSDSDDTSSESEDSDDFTFIGARNNEDVESDEDDDQADVVFDEQETESRQFDNIDDEIEYLKDNAFRQESVPAAPQSHQHSPIPPRQPSPVPPSEPTPPAREESLEPEPEPEPEWKSTKQLTVFRETATRVAEDYLKSKNVKLSKRRAGAKPKDWKTFNEGKKDGRKIDIRQKALEDKKDEEGL